jgi:hypothetical protein
MAKTDSGAQPQVTLGKMSYNMILKTALTVLKLVLLLLLICRFDWRKYILQLTQCRDS